MNKTLHSTMLSVSVQGIELGIEIQHYRIAIRFFSFRCSIYIHTYLLERKTNKSKSARQRLTVTSIRS